jgi:hypothetical protein
MNKANKKQGKLKCLFLKDGVNTLWQIAKRNHVILDIFHVENQLLTKTYYFSYETAIHESNMEGFEREFMELINEQ